MSSARIVIVLAGSTIERVLHTGERVLAFCGNDKDREVYVVGDTVREDLGPIDIARAIADGLNDARCCLVPPTIFAPYQDTGDF